jgi:hypothetical protein
MINSDFYYQNSYNKIAVKLSELPIPRSPKSCEFVKTITDQGAEILQEIQQILNRQLAAELTIIALGSNSLSDDLLAIATSWLMISIESKLTIFELACHSYFKLINQHNVDYQASLQ